MTPQIIRIRSENADFQRLELLGRSREGRRRHGLFVVEGVRAVNLALERGWAVEGLVFAEGRSPSRWAEGVLARAGAARHYVVAPQGYDLLTDRAEGSELLALLHLPPDDPARIPTPPDFRGLLLDRPGNPGNLGSIVRSADAFGMHGVVTVGHGVDPYSREAIRASTGSLLSVPVVQFPGPRELDAWVAEVRARLGSLRLIGSDEHGEMMAREFGWDGPLLLAAGNETRGLSAALRERCDATLRIPITGSASSLNVAAATSVLLYEWSTRRPAPGPTRG